MQRSRQPRALSLLVTTDRTGPVLQCTPLRARAGRVPRRPGPGGILGWFCHLSSHDHEPSSVCPHGWTWRLGWHGTPALIERACRHDSPRHSVYQGGRPRPGPRARRVTRSGDAPLLRSSSHSRLPRLCIYRVADADAHVSAVRAPLTAPACDRELYIRPTQPECARSHCHCPLLCYQQ
jgi:hypothetical protein